MLCTTPECSIEQHATVPGAQLPLRRDEVVSTGFVLQTLLVMVILLAGMAMALKWIAKRNPSRWLTKSAKRIVVLESSRLSARTNLVLLEVDGRRAVVTESPQGASLQFLQQCSSDVVASAEFHGKQEEGPVS